MRSIRRLDRGRNHGQVFPPLGRMCFTQDHLTFDAQGWCVEDGEPPTPEELKRLTGDKGAPKGASSVSGGGDPQAPPAITEAPLDLRARTVTEWKTEFRFQVLRKALVEQKGFNAQNLVAAIRFLDGQGLVVKDEG